MCSIDATFCQHDNFILLRCAQRRVKAFRACGLCVEAGQTLLAEVSWTLTSTRKSGNVVQKESPEEGKCHCSPKVISLDAFIRGTRIRFGEKQVTACLNQSMHTSPRRSSTKAKAEAY